MNEITRKVELWICAALYGGIDGLRVYPAKGGDDTADGAAIEPPFAVVEATEAEKILPNEPTWLAEVVVTYVTHIDDTASPVHSQTVHAIYDQLELLPRGYFAPQQLTVHGTNISGTDDVTDE